MRYQINSKKFGLCEFVKAGEYIKIYLGNGEWKQIFKGGDFFGSAVRCMDDNFEAECQKWHRQRLKLNAKGNRYARQFAQPALTRYLGNDLHVEGFDDE